MMIKLSVVLFALNIIAVVHGEGIYTLIAPGTIRSYFNYNVAFTLHQADGTCEIEIGLSDSKNFNKTQILQIKPMSTENIEFQIPNINYGKYRLTVKGITGISFENSTDLNYNPYKPLVYIQLDKPIYKPGDVVQFRVIFLNQKTYPEELKQAVTILVKDGVYNAVQQWKNVNLTHGVFTNSFQISDHHRGIRDWWRIEVRYEEEQLVRKEFGIVQYDLPQFEVNVDVPNDIALTDEVINITVNTKYTFGKPLKGKATVIIWFRQANQMGVEPPAGKFEISKTFPIVGKAHVEFNILKDLPKPEVALESSIFPIDYDVYASVEEDLTGNIQNASVSYFVLHEHNALIKTLEPATKLYNSGELITYMLMGQKFDGTPIQDNVNNVELNIDDFVYFSTFNANGIATFKFKLPAGLNAQVYSTYLDEVMFHGIIKPMNVEEEEEPTEEITPDRFQLIRGTQIPQLRKDLPIELKWNEPINYFVYIIVGRGNIIKVEHIEVPIDSRTYNITIKPILDMIPESHIFVYYIYNENLRFEEIEINFEEDFENTIDITTNSKANVGDAIDFKLTTDPYSYVGILGIDQRILHYGNDHDFDKHAIFKDLLGYKTETPFIPGSGRYPGKISGLVSLTNAHFPWSTVQYYYPGGGGQLTPPVPRKRFPETWIFENFYIGNETEFNFTRTIPDSITTWVITGFSMNPNTGFALTKEPTRIQVFKPFFITLNLPYSVKQGEVISILVLVYNYMNETADTEVSLDNSDKEFEFVQATNEMEDRSIDKIKEDKLVTVPSDSTGSVSFLIKPKIIGMLTLKVTALTALAGDSVHQTLKVEPEGVTQYQNHAYFINLNDVQEQNETIKIDIPDNAVPFSEEIEISAVGDIIGLSIKYIENLVRLPVGYGEQNMINFVPSILVLKYLQTVDQKLPNVTKTALNILKIGFQRELSFRHNDGSYSAYGRSENTGNSDKVGSTWLTAYVAKSFLQASEFINIESKLISSALEFLISKQTTNGKFAEFGHLLEFPNLSDVSLSAFVLLAFLETEENFSKYESNIKKGIKFLIRNINDKENIHALSIGALVLQKSKHPLADEVLQNLVSLAKNENDLTWWSAESNEQMKHKSYVVKSSDIEITSYALQAILEKGLTKEALPIVKWLTKQRNSNGGFKSTQDTVVGLQALIKFAKKTGLSRIGTMDIDYICEGNGVQDKGMIQIKPENLLMLNTHELPKKTRSVAFTAKGNTSSLIQISYHYNTIDKEPEQSLRLNISVRDNTSTKQLILDICAQYVPSDDDEKGETNMIVIEANLPSGYSTNGRENLDKLRDFKTVLFTETKQSDTIAIVYLRSLEASVGKCIAIEATKIYDVAMQKPTPVLLYEYDDKESRAVDYYVVKSSLCDICEGDNCVDDCKKHKDMTNDAAAASATVSL